MEEQLPAVLKALSEILRIMFYLLMIRLVIIIAAIIRTHYRIMEIIPILNADLLEFVRRRYNGTQWEYLRAKYNEKEELLRFQILKTLRERFSSEMNVFDKSFLMDFIELLEEANSRWSVVEFVKHYDAPITETHEHGRFHKTWSYSDTKTVFQIAVTNKFKHGAREERYLLEGLPELVIKEIKELRVCRKVLYQSGRHA
jgi:hypothetical protein